MTLDLSVGQRRVLETLAGHGGTATYAQIIAGEPDRDLGSRRRPTKVWPSPSVRVVVFQGLAEFLDLAVLTKVLKPWEQRRLAITATGRSAIGRPGL